MTDRAQEELLARLQAWVDQTTARGNVLMPRIQEAVNLMDDAIRALSRTPSPDSIGEDALVAEFVEALDWAGHAPAEKSSCRLCEVSAKIIARLNALNTRGRG